MFSSAELIQALRKRTRRSLRPQRPPGEFPAGWQVWFASIGARIGAITGASSDAIIAILLQRAPVAAPARVGEPNRWQSFAMLWRQQWQPPGREDRRLRIAACAITFLVHVVLLLILLWLASIRLVGTQAAQGEQVVQVEYVGAGTPEQAAAAPVGTTPRPAPARAAAAARTAPTAAAAARAAPARPAPQPAESLPLPPAAAQPLQVTQVARPDTAFVLPAPNPQAVDVKRPALETPQAQASVQVVDIAPALPATPALRPQLTQIPIAQPQLRQAAAAVTLREPPSPVPQVPAPVPAQRPLQVPDLLPATRVPPLPAAAPVAATAAASAPAPARVANTATAQPAGTPAARSGMPPRARAAASGTAPVAEPGAAPSPLRGDDWGAAARSRPGADSGRQPGLFNADGSPRLPAGSRPAPGGGLAPGTIEQDIANLDRAGTWLRRPPNDFTPTRFDQFWAPNETLLAEWVRRNIREVSIPIPGTSKTLRCVVSLLQLGGGCGITDPDMQDQEAVARPPPLVPFKPELQQDQDALAKPPRSP